MIETNVTVEVFHDDQPEEVVSKITTALARIGVTVVDESKEDIPIIRLTITNDRYP